MPIKKINYSQFALLFIVLLMAIIPNAEARATEKAFVSLDYSPLTKTVTISNMLNPIATLTLRENECRFNGYGERSYCWGRIEVSTEFDFDTGKIDEFTSKFTALNGGLYDWDVKWFEMVNESYDYECIKGWTNKTVYSLIYLNYSYPKEAVMGLCQGSRITDKQIISPSKSKDTNYVMKIEGLLEPNSAVEWIPTFYGVKIPEWAMWLTNYTSYYNGSINTSSTVALFNFTHLINYSTGFYNNIIWCRNKNVPKSSVNGSYIFYENSATDYRYVNASDNTEECCEVEKGNAPNRTGCIGKSAWDYNYSLVYHGTSCGMDSSPTAFSGNCSTGTATNTSGYMGSATSFDSKQLSNVTFKDYDFTGGEGTQSGWVYLFNTGTSHAIIWNKAGTGTNWEALVVVMTTNVLRCLGRETVKQVDTNTSLAANTWYHFACVWNGTNLAVYLNGTRENSRNDEPAAWTDKNIEWTLGAEPANVYYLNGSLDEIRLSNRAYSDDEVKAEYETQRYNYTMSGTKQTGNTAPFINNITITPNPTNTESTLNCSANYGDAENNAGTVNISFYNGTVIYYSINKTSVAAGKLVSQNLTAGVQNLGETWNCSMNPDDGSMNGLQNSTAITVSAFFTVATYAPLNRTNTTDNTPDFVFNYTHNSASAGNCYVNVNDTTMGNNASTVSGKNTTITSGALNDSLNQQWYVRCYEGGEGVNSTKNIIGIDTTSPIVSLSYPSGEYFTYGLPYQGLPVNFSYTELNPSTCWYYTNVSNITLPACGNTTINTTLTANYTFWLYMNDTFGKEGYDMNDFSINLINVSSSADKGNVSESEYVTFTFQINSTNMTSINATFYYNDTAYTYSTKVNNSKQANLTRILIIPDLNVSYVGYYWNFTINSHNNLTDKKNLTVSELNATISATCSAGMSASHNFSLKDEVNSTLLYGNVKYNIQYGINSSQYLTYGELYNVSTFQICINASVNYNYSVNYGEIEYSVDGYETRKYYLFINSSLDNRTKTVDLYNLEDGEATSFKFSAEDSVLNPYIGYYLSLLRWYPENNTYKVVEMAKTNEEGETIMSVKKETVDYRVGLYEIDGSLVKLTSPTKMICLTTPCSYKISVLGEGEEYTSALGIETLITYSSGVVTFTWNDPSQKSEEIIFWVYKDTGYTYSTLCNTSSTSFTGALSCNITGYTGTIVAKGYRTASPTIPIALRIISIREAIDKGIGLFAQLIMSIILGFMAVWHPVAAILFSIIPFLVGWALGITTLQVIIALAVVGGAIIHMIGRAQAK